MKPHDLKTCRAWITEITITLFALSTLIGVLKYLLADWLS